MFGKKEPHCWREFDFQRDSRMSGCTSTCKHLDVRYSAKIWGFYTQNFKISTLFIHFSLKNLVEILGDCLKLGKLGTLKYFFFISVVVCREVEWFCPMWGVYAIIEQNMAGSLQLVKLLSLVWGHSRTIFSWLRASTWVA